MSRPTSEERAAFLEEARLVAQNPFIGLPGVDAHAAKEVRRIARHCTSLADDLAEARALLAEAREGLRQAKPVLGEEAEASASGIDDFLARTK